MIYSKGYAAHQPKEALAPFKFERREPRENDVVIDISFCGVCHSDIHSVRDEWGPGKYPMVPGHEIVGKVSKVGSKVTKFKTGDLVGVGCLVNSCQNCRSCKEGLEQYCENGFVGTYNSTDKDGSLTYGGYSNNIVVNDKFVLKIPPQLKLEGVAPLLCAGITTYSPLKHWKVKKGSAVGVVGLGGLGHMAVKLAHAMGAHVTVFTTSSSKKEDAARLGADEVVISKSAEEMRIQRGKLEFLLDTVSAPHDMGSYLTTLKRDGVMVLVGIPDRPPELRPFYLIGGRKSLAGSLIGGIAETQEMLDFCAKHNITSDVEVIPISKINEAYERTIRGDVKYRFVIDMKSIG